MTETTTDIFFLGVATALHKKIINRISDPFKLSCQEIEEIRKALVNAFERGQEFANDNR